MHRFNLAYIKKHSAERALELAEEKLTEVLGVPGDTIGLYNLLPAGSGRRLPYSIGKEVFFIGFFVPLSQGQMSVLRFSSFPPVSR